MTKTSKVVAKVSKNNKSIIIELPMEYVNSKDPIITDKGNASVIGYDNRFQLEIDVNGITLPLDGDLSLWCKKKNWKNFTDNRDGIKEGNKQGTNMSAEDKALWEEFQAFKKFKEMQTK